MTGDISWLWDNPITREVVKSPQRVAQLVQIADQALNPQEVVTEITKVVEYIPANMINIPLYSRNFVRLAGLSGASAVALGAYGAHVFYRRDYPEELKQVYETANRYHFLHTLALLGVPLCRRPKIAGPMLAVGTLIFSGTCYYYALTGSKNVRQYTPYGGMLLIAGWLAMIL